MSRKHVMIFGSGGDFAPAAGGGLPELTGTPTAVTWASGADPAGQSITIPSDATAVYMFWTYYVNPDGHGLLSATLNSASPDELFEVPTGAADAPAVGVTAWYNPSTGSQTLDVAWDTAPVEGSTCIVAYVKGGSTTAWRDADGQVGDGTAALSVTLTTATDDLVLKMDMRFGTPPSTSAGWTSSQTHANNGEGAKLSYIVATGSTQVCNSEDESWSGLCAISIPPA